MAKDTRLNLRNEIIYCIYVRNHTPEGTFAAIIPDLQRIRGLGVDIIWFMPIHPIGETKRKGVEGSPYAIKDYRAVNPAYGTMDDFKALAAAIHELGMEVMIDVVYNHTSPDSQLVEQHPEWFYRRPNGEMGNKVGEWYDIVDLDYSHPELWDYQIETLKQWAASCRRLPLRCGESRAVGFLGARQKRSRGSQSGCRLVGRVGPSDFSADESGPRQYRPLRQ